MKRDRASLGAQPSSSMRLKTILKGGLLVAAGTAGLAVYDPEVRALVPCALCHGLGGSLPAPPLQSCPHQRLAGCCAAQRQQPRPGRGRPPAASERPGPALPRRRLASSASARRSRVWPCWTRCLRAASSCAGWARAPRPAPTTSSSSAAAPPAPAALWTPRRGAASAPCRERLQRGREGSERCAWHTAPQQLCTLYSSSRLQPRSDVGAAGQLTALLLRPPHAPRCPQLTPCAPFSLQGPACGVAGAGRLCRWHQLPLH